MYIIEMYGIPGCGKSTAINVAQRELKSSGFKVDNLQVRPLCLRRIARIKNELAVKFDSDCRYLKQKAKSCLKDYSDGQSQYWIWRILQECYVIKQAEKEGLEIALFDEGCIQFVTSIVHEEELPENVLDFFKAVYDTVYKKRNTTIIRCDIPIEEAVKRLKNRNRSGDRFLIGTDEEIERRMELKKDNLEKVASIFPSKDLFTLKMDDSNYIGNFETIVKNRVGNT